MPCCKYFLYNIGRFEANNTKINQALKWFEWKRHNVELKKLTGVMGGLADTTVKPRREEPDPLKTRAVDIAYI